MDIKISNKVGKTIGPEFFVKFGIDDSAWGWRERDSVALPLLRMEPAIVFELLELFKKYVNVAAISNQVRAIVRDLQAWYDVVSKEVDEKATIPNVRVFEAMLITFMRKVPGQRLYKKHGINGEGYHAFHMSSVTYHPPVRVKATKDRPAYTVPDHTSCRLRWVDYDGAQSGGEDWHIEDVKGKTIQHVLFQEGYLAETDELRAMYLKDIERYKKMFLAIGRQYLFLGGSVQSLEERSSKEDRWWNRENKTVFPAVGSRVVIDVVNEADDGRVIETEGTTRVIRKGFWEDKGGEDSSDEDSDDDTTTVEVAEPVEIPIHPWVVVFHLQKHMRMIVHASQLKRYKYDEKLIDKLVIDDTRKALVKLLVQYRDAKYADIIGNKGGGAIVMLCGKPGTGKTLTAEVFAESEKHALYSVQCAQLGTTPGALENELLKVLTRAERWNAVLLLDEADVYVHRRGKDIHQNALVGVFLRVLEYSNAVMFMTTNRAKDIDDAVASRCTAKLLYKNPDESEQQRIWRVLCVQNNVKMSDSEIKRVAVKYKTLSGRDVKNLLKLAMLVNGPKKAVTCETIDLVKQFKPT